MKYRIVRFPDAEQWMGGPPMPNYMPQSSSFWEGFGCWMNMLRGGTGFDTIEKARKLIAERAGRGKVVEVVEYFCGPT